MADMDRIKFPPPAPVSPADPPPEIFAQLAARPVAEAELPDGSTAWLVGGAEEVRQVFVDQRFSRALAAEPGRAQPGIQLSAADSIIGMDPPRHTRLRKLVASAFTLRRIEMLRPRVAVIAGELIGRFMAQPQPADLVSTFSLPLPMQVICELLGVPVADMGKFRAWSSIIVSDWEQDTGEILTALAGLYEYFAELIRIKRTQPADDLLTALIAARDSGDRLSEDELTNLACTPRSASSRWLASPPRTSSLAASRSRPARSCSRSWPRPTGTRRCSASRGGSTSLVRPDIWPSAAGRTTASGHSLPGSSFRRRCAA
jgi:cytochrome P450